MAEQSMEREHSPAAEYESLLPDGPCTAVKTAMNNSLIQKHQLAFPLIFHDAPPVHLLEALYNFY